MAELFAMATALETARGEDRAYAKGELLASANLMGFLFADPEYWFQAGVSDELREKVDGLIADRVAARSAKDWAAADRIRGDLVGADHQRAGKTSGNGAGLGFGEPAGGLGGLFSGERNFIRVGRCDFERDLQARQQVAAKG